jgi:glucokinase
VLDASVAGASRMSAVHVCIDIGSTKTVVALATQRGWLARLQQASANTGTVNALPEQLLKLIDQACEQSGVARNQIANVGVASCGPFVLHLGDKALAAPNLCGGLAGGPRGLDNDWQAIPVERELRAVFPKLRMENDCVAALIAERRWGALQGFDHCAYVTWSTGIGVGLCVDGVVLRGKNSNAGHAGHMFVADTAPWAKCGCGNVGDIEGSCGGYSLQVATGQPVEQLFTRVQQGDSTAGVLVEHAIRCFARMLYNLIVTLDLQRIAIGGSVFYHHRDWLLPRITQALPPGLVSVTAGCDIVAAGLGARVGDLAALALVAQNDWTMAQFST